MLFYGYFFKYLDSSRMHTHSWLSYNQPLFPQSQRVGPGRTQAFGETFGSCWSDVIPVSSLTLSWWLEWCLLKVTLLSWILASPSMNHEHGTVCQPILEHQIRLSAPSSVISRPTCFSSSLRCCWQVGSAPFVRRHCDCLASSVAFTNIQTYLLTYLLINLRFLQTGCPCCCSTDSVKALKAGIDVCNHQI